jgi:hypothetical protein
VTNATIYTTIDSTLSVCCWTRLRVTGSIYEQCSVIYILRSSQSHELKQLKAVHNLLLLTHMLVLQSTANLGLFQDSSPLVLILYLSSPIFNALIFRSASIESGHLIAGPPTHRVPSGSLTAESRVRAQVNPCRICCGQSGTDTGFSLSSLIISCKYHSTVVLHTHISSGRWKICPLAVIVQRRSLTPSKSTKIYPLVYGELTFCEGSVSAF